MSHSSTTCRVVEEYLASLNCPRSLAVWIMFRENEHDQLAAIECDPLHYIDFVAFRHAYLASKFLSKSDFLSMKVDKKKVAISKFLEAEEHCRSINKRGYHWTVIKQQSSEWLHNAIIRKIWSILRDFDPEEMVDLANWGPGSTLQIKGVDTSSVKKFHVERGTTRPLYNLMGELYALVYPTWDLSNQQIFKGNKVVTVPKNSKTDRTIAIEPGLNVWFQLGVGRMIRRRLRRVGIDLSDQSRNQRLAREGSNTDLLATVDFSMASDTIARKTVEALLPPQWFSVMDILRSRYGCLGSDIFEYEKFSSMGNGFTFELETLIFYAIAFACCSKLGISTEQISVYGDDVIIPKDALPLFSSTCTFYGFTVNTTKSFSSGYFRESCGSHWYAGQSCKPYFLRRDIVGTLEKIKVANGIRRLAFNGDVFPHCDKTFYPLFTFLTRTVRKARFISDGYGDGAFIGNFDEASPSKAKHGIEGYFAFSLVVTPCGYETDHSGLLLSRLRDRSVEINFGNEVYLRRRVKISRKRILIRRWFNLGPWL